MPQVGLAHQRVVEWIKGFKNARFVYYEMLLSDKTLTSWRLANHKG